MCVDVADAGGRGGLGAVCGQIDNYRASQQMSVYGSSLCMYNSLLCFSSSFIGVALLQFFYAYMYIDLFVFYQFYFPFAFVSFRFSFFYLILFMNNFSIFH